MGVGCGPRGPPERVGGSLVLLWPQQRWFLSTLAELSDSMSPAQRVQPAHGDPWLRGPQGLLGKPSPLERGAHLAAGHGLCTAFLGEPSSCLPRTGAAAFQLCPEETEWVTPRTAEPQHLSDPQDLPSAELALSTPMPRALLVGCGTGSVQGRPLPEPISHLCRGCRDEARPPAASHVGLAQSLVTTG